MHHWGLVRNFKGCCGLDEWLSISGMLRALFHCSGDPVRSKSLVHESMEPVTKAVRLGIETAGNIF